MIKLSSNSLDFTALPCQKTRKVELCLVLWISAVKVFLMTISYEHLVKRSKVSLILSKLVKVELSRVALSITSNLIDWLIGSLFNHQILLRSSLHNATLTIGD